MQTSLALSAAAAIKYFAYGFGTASGVIVFLFGLLGWFVSRKLDSLDMLSKQVADHELRIGNAEVRCGERHRKK